MRQNARHTQMQRFFAKESLLRKVDQRVRAVNSEMISGVENYERICFEKIAVCL